MARIEKLAEAIRKETALILQQELNDPRVSLVTITSAKLSKDLREVRIYFSVLGGKKEKERAKQGLTSCKGYVRKLLSQRIRLRFMPRINFELDESIEELTRISEKIEKLKKEGEL